MKKLFFVLSFAAFAAVSAEEVIVCDQQDQSIKIYDVSGDGDAFGELRWKWSGREDTVIPKKYRRKFAGNVAECKMTPDGTAVQVVACAGCWAIVDIKKRQAVAWGLNKMMTHSLELLEDDIVAAVATGGLHKGGLLWLFDIKGDKALDPKKQNGKSFVFDNPHGLHWDTETKLLWVLDTPALTSCKVSRKADGTFVLERQNIYSLLDEGVTYGHDLRPVPGTRLLALTTHEKVMFFDMDRRRFLQDRSIVKKDVKAYDPTAKGRALVTTARTKWWTDTLEICEDGKIRDFKKLEGAKFYKARWR